MNKKVHIITRGCQMNSRDSEFVMGILLDDGFRAAESIDDADIILFNSCSVRKHAEDRLFSNIAALNRIKRKNPNLIIGLMGCVAQNYKEKILERLPMVDLVCGPGNESELPKIINEVLKDRCSIIATDKVNEKRPEQFPEYRSQQFKAYVSISEGCSNYCSYCIVPYVRGKERSRNMKDIIREIEGLAQRGFKEVTLLGQNVNSYKGKDTKDFVKLLTEINKISGIERIRFMTSHPKDASGDLFKAMRDMGKVCEHLHLPLQSGSNRVLKLMNRDYTQAKYLELIQDYRIILPEGAITTDIIVGFPNESASDFQKTVDLIERIGFDSAFMFKYSPRPPAKSARLRDDIPDKVKEKRLEILLDLQRRISQKRNDAMVGREFEVLVDGQNEKEPSKLTGRTRTNKVVVFEGDKRFIGKFASVKIESASPYVLKGRLV